MTPTIKIRSVISKTLSSIGIKRNRTIIPKISIDELFDSTLKNIEPIEAKVDNGNITLEELKIISQIVYMAKPMTIFEIGTFNGRTTANLAYFSPASATVYTIDLPKNDLDKTKFDIQVGDRAYVEKDVIGDRFIKNNNKIIQLYGDSASFDFTPYFNKIDFVFVDGAHSSPYVRNDTEIAFKLAKVGGIVIWHDYGVWRDVTKVLNKYFLADARFTNIRHIANSCFVYYKKQ